MPKYALCVGCNYPGTGSELYGCVNDAEDWSTVLAERGYEVDTLFNEEATAAEILSKLAAMVSRCEYGDIACFTFSGHGSWVPDESGDEPDGRDEVICPADIEQGIWISDDQLAEVFAERARGARVVMLADSCHSGTVSRLSTALRPHERASKIRFLPPEVFYGRNSPEILDVRGIGSRPAKAAGSSASLLISGCKDTEYSYDAWFGDRANGAFTRAAIDALKEVHATASYAEWHRKIRTKLPSASYPQTPQLLAAGFQKKWPALGEGR